MNITVGGMLIASGISVTVVTIAATIFVAFAYGMSDAPQDKMGCTVPIIGLLVGIGLVLIGKFSGL